MTKPVFKQKIALIPLLISCIYSQTAVSAEVTVLDTIDVQEEASKEEVGAVMIDLEDIKRINPITVQDLFRATPEVQVGSSLPISQKVYVNGIEETNLSVTIDGARQNNKLFHHSGTNLIDPQLLKAVGVDAGVAPADAGPGALGGSIAYETKDVADLLAPGDNFGGMLSLQYNNNGATFTTDLSLFGRAENGLEALAYLKRATGDEFEDGDGNEVLASETAFTSGLFKIGYLHDSGYRAKVSFERVKDDASRPFRANFAGRFAGDTGTQKYQLVRETIVASIKDETPEGFFNPYIKLAHTESDLKTGTENRGIYKSLNGTIANAFVLPIGTVDAGFDFYDDTSEGVFDGWATFEEEARNIGFFAQARLTPSDRSRVSFGMRYDDHELEGIDGSESNNSGASGNVSGEFDITPFLTASAGYSHVFGGVQLMEPYIGNPNWVYPASGLDESEANNSFVGLQLNGEGLNAGLAGLTVGIKYFNTDIENVRDENFRSGPANYSDVKTDGYQINAQYDWQSGYARITYMDMDTEINGFNGTTDGQYLGTPIGESIQASFVHAFDHIGVSIGGDIQHFFEMDGDNIFAATPAQVRVDDVFPEYTLANAFVAYTPHRYDNLTLHFAINNILDEGYADRATYGQEYAQAFGTQILQQPGRSLVFSARVRF